MPTLAIDDFNRSNAGRSAGALAAWTEIRSRGIYLVVDDLGAGYSNLKYIADLHPRVVKLDRELIAGLVADSRLFKLVAGIVVMCRELGAMSPGNDQIPVAAIARLA